MDEQKKEAPVAKLKCIYGNKVKLKNLQTNTITEYTLVPLNKENLNENKISNYTKIGKAIWAKVENDEVKIETNDNQWTAYQIVEIDHAS